MYHLLYITMYPPQTPPPPPPTHNQHYGCYNLVQWYINPSQLGPSPTNTIPCPQSHNFSNTPLPNKQPHHFLQFSQQSPGILNCCQFCYCYCLNHSFLDGPDEVHHNVYEIYWLCLGNARLLFQLDLNISCGLISSTFTSYAQKPGGSF